MLNRSGLLCVFLYLLSFQANAQNKGIIFFEGTWEEALAKAQKEHKIIFVDAYTTWCGPCKRMSAEVFTDAAVGEYFNKNFVNLKIDMEKSEGIKFGQKYEVSSYPTLLFIDAEGKEVNVAKGSRPADQFLALGKATLNGLDNSADFAEKYEAGERSPEFLRAYAYQLQMADKPTLKIANDYLRTQKDLTTVSNLEFLLDFCTESDSRIFDLLCQHQAAVLKTFNVQTFEKRIEQACNATLQKSVRLDLPALSEQAKTAMKKARPNFAKEYNYLADIQLVAYKKEFPKMVELVDKYLQKFAKNDPIRLYEQTTFVLKQAPDKIALQKSELWMQQAVKLDNRNTDYLKLYMEILVRNGKVTEAQAVNNQILLLQKS